MHTIVSSFTIHQFLSRIYTRGTLLGSAANARYAYWGINWRHVLLCTSIAAALRDQSRSFWCFAFGSARPSHGTFMVLPLSVLPPADVYAVAEMCFRSISGVLLRVAVIFRIDCFRRHFNCKMTLFLLLWEYYSFSTHILFNTVLFHSHTLTNFRWMYTAIEIL